MRGATRKHTASPHFLCGEQGAADKQQHVRSIVLDTSAQHGTDATHKMEHTTGAAACSKHTRNRHHAEGIETNGMRHETKGSRTLGTSRLWNHSKAPKVF